MSTPVGKGGPVERAVIGRDWVQEIIRTAAQDSALTLDPVAYQVRRAAAWAIARLCFGEAVRPRPFAPACASGMGLYCLYVRIEMCGCGPAELCGRQAAHLRRLAFRCPASPLSTL